MLNQEPNEVNTFYSCAVVFWTQTLQDIGQCLRCRIKLDNLFCQFPHFFSHLLNIMPQLHYSKRIHFKAKKTLKNSIIEIAHSNAIKLHQHCTCEHNANSTIKSTPFEGKKKSPFPLNREEIQLLLIQSASMYPPLTCRKVQEEILAPVVLTKNCKVNIPCNLPSLFEWKDKKSSQETIIPLKDMLCLIYRIAKQTISKVYLKLQQFPCG